MSFEPGSPKPPAVRRAEQHQQRGTLRIPQLDVRLFERLTVADEATAVTDEPVFVSVDVHVSETEPKPRCGGLVPLSPSHTVPAVESEILRYVEAHRRAERLEAQGHVQVDEVVV